MRLNKVLKEFKVVDSIFNVQINGIKLPANLWQGTILKGTGHQAGMANGETIAIRNKQEKGEVFWAPTLLGLGARLTGNYSALIQLLERELRTTISRLPVVFKNPHPHMLIKTLRSGNCFISVIINKSKDKCNLAFQTCFSVNQAQILFANKSGNIRSGNIEINPEETIILKWGE